MTPTLTKRLLILSSGMWNTTECALIGGGQAGEGIGTLSVRVCHRSRSPSPKKSHCRANAARNLQMPAAAGAVNRVRSSSVGEDNLLSRSQGLGGTRPWKPCREPIGRALQVRKAVVEASGIRGLCYLYRSAELANTSGIVIVDSPPVTSTTPLLNRVAV